MVVKTTSERMETIATAIYPKCIESIEKILWRGQSCGEDLPQIAAAKMAVRYANELLKQLAAYEKIRFNEEERRNF